MEKKKKGMILTVLALVSVMIITVGVTLAFFNYAKEGSTENSVTTGAITFLYTEVSGVGRGISISDAYPISDTVGKVQVGEGNVFDFKVTSTTPNKTSIPYEVTARKKSDSTLDESAVKLYLTKVTGTDEEEVLLSKYSELVQTSKVEASKYTEKTIYTGKVPSNSTNYEQAFRLRMWIDENTDFSPNADGTYPYNGKTFTVTVNVYANAKIVTEADILLESNNEIASIQVGNTKAIQVDDKEYQYELGLDSGTTSANLTILTESLDTTVSVEKIDSLASINSTQSYSVKKLASSKQIQLENGNNYFKIKTKALTGEEKTSILNVHVGKYSEDILNETDPVLSNNLIPVVLLNDGTVQKVNTNYSWYDYEEKVWANAVVLKDSSITYLDGEVIPEENIESYFVWIPRYKYKIFNTGNYTGLTSIGNSAKTIEIIFENKNTTPSNGTTVNSYLTHPAFQAFNTNGLWVGKFETGYNGATSTTSAEVNSNDSSKIIIKPNVYSWRNLTLGNMFKASFDYLRTDESHMMKNTEWGAVAYLSHSKYGTCTNGQCSEVRINNNSSYITGYAGTEAPTKGYNGGTSTVGNRVEGTALATDGTYTVNYLNSLSNVASTTLNKSGVYDMSGGAWEYVMGYTTGASIVGGSSEIMSVYSDFFTNSSWNKYYDKYTSTSNVNYNYRILGDATGEMGPFGSQLDPDGYNRYKSSWYGDYAHFVDSSNPWFGRGIHWSGGTAVGAFAFYSSTGGASTYLSFRVVLAP